MHPKRGSDAWHQIRTWSEWKDREDLHLVRMVDEIRERCSDDTQVQHNVVKALRGAQLKLARHIQETCNATMRFTDAIMSLPDETRAGDCARGVLEMDPIFHALCGSSFNEDLLHTRKTALEHAGMRNVRQIAQEARTLLVALVKAEWLRLQKIDKNPKL